MPLSVRKTARKILIDLYLVLTRKPNVWALQQEVGQCNRAAHSLLMWQGSSPYAVRTFKVDAS